AITVRSENGPHNCIIDCEGTKQDPHRGFHFRSREDANSILSGFTITNGYAFGSSYKGRSGGAIRCDNSNPTIANCIITENAGHWDAGGIVNYDSSPTITNCIFSRNVAVTNDGGAINNDRSSPTITNCKFIGNAAFDWGGAIRNIYFCKPIITNCVLSGNSADDGGAMFYWFGCNPTIINCTFAGNSAHNGNALASNHHVQGSLNYINLTNCILADGGNEVFTGGNSTITVTYSNVQDGYPGTGNIDADPCFVSPGYWADANDPNIVVEPNDPNAVWIEGDYQLKAVSPCVDAGDNNSVPADTADVDGDGNTTEPIPWDLDGNPRIVDRNNDGNAVVDMGAFEAPVPPIEAPMKFTPRTLKLGSKGKWVKAHCLLPEGYRVDDVDANRPATLELLGIEVQSKYIDVFVNDDNLVEVEIAFERRAFCGAGAHYDWAQATVTGWLTSGQRFRGADTIKIGLRQLLRVGLPAVSVFAVPTQSR
ncbi:MAG: right-handed parallel beta-helix repeat-containing protein, partial [Planctomycetota bacterium]